MEKKNRIKREEKGAALGGYLRMLENSGRWSNKGPTGEIFVEAKESKGERKSRKKRKEKNSTIIRGDYRSRKWTKRKRGIVDVGGYGWERTIVFFRAV